MQETPNYFADDDNNNANKNEFDEEEEEEEEEERVEGRRGRSVKRHIDKLKAATSAVTWRLRSKKQTSKPESQRSPQRQRVEPTQQRHHQQQQQSRRLESALGFEPGMDNTMTISVEEENRALVKNNKGKEAGVGGGIGPVGGVGVSDDIEDNKSGNNVVERRGEKFKKDVSSFLQSAHQRVRSRSRGVLPRRRKKGVSSGGKGTSGKGTSGKGTSGKGKGNAAAKDASGQRQQQQRQHRTFDDDLDSSDEEEISCCGSDCSCSGTEFEDDQDCGRPDCACACACQNCDDDDFAVEDLNVAQGGGGGGGGGRGGEGGDGGGWKDGKMSRWRKRIESQVQKRVGRVLKATTSSSSANHAMAADDDDDEFLQIQRFRQRHLQHRRRPQIAMN